MNFLELCNEVKDQGSSGGVPLTSVEGQTGINARIVRWVNQSYQEIVRHRDDWAWLFVKGFTFNTSANKRDYPASELSLTNVGKWDLRNARIVLASADKSTETRLQEIAYNQWDNSLALGTQDVNRPTYIFTAPGTKNLILHCIPDGEYTVTLKYWKTVSNLVADSDTPVIPTEYHDIIVYKSLMKYGVYDDANEIYADALNQYVGLLERMEETGMEEFRFNYRALY